MPKPEGTRGLFMDMPQWGEAPKPDDFLVAVSNLKSGAVYLVASIRHVNQKRPRARVKRYAMRVFRVDLSTLLRRDRDQVVHTMRWYPRGKKR